MKKADSFRVTATMGKIPPQNLETEEAVLGSILLQGNIIDEIIDVLPEEAFYKSAHQEIYKACKQLYYRSEPIDLITLTNELRRTDTLEIAGGAYHIGTLTNRIGSTANIKNHAKIILEAYAQREIIRVSSTAIQDAFENEDIFELIEWMDNEVQKIRETMIGKSDIFEWTDQVHKTISKIESLYKSEIKVSGIPTGNPKLDSITGGWQKTDLIILAGRPGSGKSTRAINLTKHACLSGKGVCMFSLEMSWEQIVRKFINDETDIYIKKLVTGELTNLDIQKIANSKAKLAKMNFYLNDKAAINPSYIRTILRQRQKKHAIDLIIVDYTQIMSPNEKVKGRSRDTELGTISGGLKNLAKEFNVPLITLCQLSRKCEERPDKRPILSDLRESGSLENDADIVIGLYRPSYYYDYQKDKDYQKEIEEWRVNGLTEAQVEERYKRLSEMLILKHRNGETDRRIKENFYGEFSRFIPIDVPKPTNGFINPNDRIEPQKINDTEEVPF